jgi:hypothetical protein
MNRSRRTAHLILRSDRRQENSSEGEKSEIIFHILTIIYSVCSFITGLIDDILTTVYVVNVSQDCIFVVKPKN